MRMGNLFDTHWPQTMPLPNPEFRESILDLMELAARYEGERVRAETR